VLDSIGALTHLAEELMDALVDILVRVVELGNDGLRLGGESHGVWLGDGM